MNKEKAEARKKKRRDKRKEVYNKCNGHCTYCGREITFRQMQVDHIIPKAHFSKKHKCLIVNGRKFTEYGLDDIRNLNPSCKKCNRFKTAMPLEAFRKELSLQVTRLKKNAQFDRALIYDQIQINESPIVFYFEKIETIEMANGSSIKLIPSDEKIQGSNS